MDLDKALDVLKRALIKQKEYDSGRVAENLIIDGKNYKNWIITAFKDGKIDMEFFKGWIKINNMIFEFLDKDPTHNMNSLNKVLQELE